MRDGTRIFGAMIDLIDQRAGNGRARIVHVVQRQRGERFATALHRGRGARREGASHRRLGGKPETTRAFWRKLREGGVDVRIFNQPGFRAWLGLLPRDHRKVLVADEEVCVTGGIGLAEVWSGFVKRKKRAPWRDTAVLIRGPAAADMARAFETMWKRANFEERRAARRHVVRRARNSGTWSRAIDGRGGRDHRGRAVAPPRRARAADPVGVRGARRSGSRARTSIRRARRSRRCAARR